ncbi:MAG: UvrB/UvrC motif-containing protein, partial [Verrucomicrobiota bacterium]
CILDADKEGFLRSQTSLIQTAGRAARHVNGQVYLFADTLTKSIRALLNITEYRRSKQMEHNKAHGITPQSVRRAVQESLHTILRGSEDGASGGVASGPMDIAETLRELEADMVKAAGELEYEKAALLRDQIRELKGASGIAPTPQKKTSKGGFRRQKAK